jgi:Pyruvate/2-oxoacid:ferredoxin oxidoreductase delta subunit
MHASLPNPADFAEMLVDIYSASKPALTIVDGITAIEGNGPGAGGKLVDLGILLAGTDPVAMDTICTEIMGFEQTTVLTTQAAARRGLGTNNLAEIEVKGVPLKEVQRKFEFPSSYKTMRFLFSRLGRLISPLMKKFTHVRATYEKSKCVSCGDCVKICPAQALAINQVGAPPTWTKARCIACYCCSEVCPKGAAHVGIAGIRGVWQYLVILLAALVGIILLIVWLFSLP